MDNQETYDENLEASFIVEDLLAANPKKAKALQQRQNSRGVPRGAVPTRDADGNYKFHLKKETAWKESDIGIDPETGWRYQQWALGMTRNAKEENRKVDTVFLDPITHIVKDQNLP